MEPMTLGSPPHSHSHHNVQAGLSQSGQFLPGYLMGDPMPSASPSSSRVWSSRSSTSPTKPGMTPSNLGPRDNRAQRASVSHTPKGKDAAPPVSGLFDNMDSLKGSPAVGGLGMSYGGTPDRLELSQHGLPPTPRTPGPPMHMSGTPGSSRLFSPQPHQTSQHHHNYSLSQQAPASPAQIDPFYTQGEAITTDDQLNETWVTVFGFPPAATSFILQQFSQYGSIVKHVVASSGNWMHLQYSSKIQAKKALSKNGKILGGSIMIGVRLCIDKSIMDGRECDVTTSFVQSPTQGGAGTPQRSFSLRTASTGSHESDVQRSGTSIRPLTAAYRAASSNHEVLQDGGTPQKSANIVSKTLEYMFGW